MNSELKEALSLIHQGCVRVFLVGKGEKLEDDLIDLCIALHNSSTGKKVSKGGATLLAELISTSSQLTLAFSQRSLHWTLCSHLNHVNCGGKTPLSGCSIYSGNCLVTKTFLAFSSMLHSKILFFPFFLESSSFQIQCDRRGQQQVEVGEYAGKDEGSS